MIVAAVVFSQPDFQNYEPVRKARTGYGELVDDLESHAQPGHPMRNTGDLVNWVHELTHWVNAELRNSVNTGATRYNCFYVFKNRYVVFPEPAVTLEQVAAEVHNRGDSFELYLVQAQRWWNLEPLYVLDELTAYVNGHLQDQTDKYCRENCLEMLRYAAALDRAIVKHDPDWQHLEKMREFVKWNKARIK